MENGMKSGIFKTRGLFAMMNGEEAATKKRGLKAGEPKTNSAREGAAGLMREND